MAIMVAIMAGVTAIMATQVIMAIGVMATGGITLGDIAITGGMGPGLCSGSDIDDLTKDAPSHDEMIQKMGDR